ncbi:oligosaccharide flippase family protein, partial [Ruminococcaceae bacterium OttesenSCG-928-N02]|nr:oligosaccharide flippase family protein [Ruminococcaceae bacterium OttesenSCG-928-N02]
MNRYKKLISNTALFAISTLSSKVLVFLLMPLYTSILTPAQYSTVDLTVQAANLLVPLVSMGIMNAVVRFGLDKGYSHKGVFTAGVYTIAGGYIVFLLAMPLFKSEAIFAFLKGNVGIFYVYVLTACLRSLFSQFVRARNYTRLYAVDGIVSTVFTIFFNVLFLVQFEWGVQGYLLAIVAADVVSCLFLFTMAGLHRFFSPRTLEKTMLGEMLRYSLPLVPATVFWWVTSVSDRYMVALMVGEAANGLYAAACKIPTIVTLFSTIFTEAWQLSAVQEKDSRSLGKFFTTIFSGLQGVVFIAATLLIATAKISTSLLVDETFFSAWQYTPVLIVATVFSA